MAAKRIAHYGSMEAPFGELWIALSERGVVRLAYDTNEAELCHLLERDGYEPEFDPAAVGDAVQQMEEYFAGTRHEPALPLDLSALPPFRRAVLEAVAAVPWGQVRSYGDIAAEVGKPRAARAVGAAIGANPISFLVPCHRIIRSDGTIGEYGTSSRGRAWAITHKRRLLAQEGIHL